MSQFSKGIHTPPTLPLELLTAERTDLLWSGGQILGAAKVLIHINLGVRVSRVECVK